MAVEEYALGRRRGPGLGYRVKCHASKICRGALGEAFEEVAAAG